MNAGGTWTAGGAREDADGLDKSHVVHVTAQLNEACVDLVQGLAPDACNGKAQHVRRKTTEAM